MTKRLVSVVALVVAASTGAVAYYRSRQAEALPTPAMSPVTRGDVIAKVDATGTLAPVTTVEVGSQVSGSIKALRADFNSRVHRGQVIAELEPSLFQAQVDQARATTKRLEADVDRARVQVDDTRRKLARAQELFAKQLLAATDLETAEANAKQAEASLTSAQAEVVQARAALNQTEVNLSHTIIRAPIDGIVISRNVDVGQTVAASMQAPVLFVIAQDLTRMQVSARVDEADIGRVASGQAVTFRVDAYPTRVFTGTVSQVRLEPKTEQNVVSYTTIIDVSNDQLLLKPGMTASVAIELASAHGVLTVPSTALRFRPTPDMFAALHQVAPDESGSATSTTGGRGTRQGRSTGGAAAEQRRAGGATDEGETPHPGQVWVWKDGRIERVRVVVGLSNGPTTAVLGGDLAEGDQVVTAFATTPSPAAAATGSPLLPFGRRGGGASGANRGGGAVPAGGGR